MTAKKNFRAGGAHREARLPVAAVVRLRLVCLALLVAVAATPIWARASTQIVCERATITKVRLPTGDSGSEMGLLVFSDKRAAKVWGSDQDPQKWAILHTGDHVMTCVDNRSDPRDPTDKVYKIFVVDFDANTWLDTVWDSSKSP